MIKQPELRARCTDEELIALREVAKLEHRKPTEMLRELVRDAAKRLGVWPPVPGSAPDGSGGDGDA